MAFTVMVVDDSYMVRQQVSKTLAGAGFNIVEAHDGADALAKLPAADPSLIVLDLNMPNMGGIDFLKNLKAATAHSKVPVVMLTTDAQPRIMKEAKLLGARGWIVKPFRPEMLVAAVQKLVAPAAVPA